MYGLETIIGEKEQELQEALEAAKMAEDSNFALRNIMSSLESVREAISEVAIDHVTVENMDEVRAAVHNELNRISKPILAALSGMQLSNEKIEGIRADIERKNILALTESHDIQIVKRPKQKITIDNLGDIIFPDKFDLANIDVLRDYLNELAEKLEKSLNITVQAPEVTVNPPEVNIPEITIPESSIDIDLDSVIKALDPLKYLSDRAKKPLSVRLSDGNAFLKQIQTIAANQQKQVQAFSQGLTESSAIKAFKKASVAHTIKGEGRKALTDSSAGVALGTGATNFIDITANGGQIAIGTSTSVQMDTPTGVILTPGTAPYRVYSNNLSNVFASGSTGSSACFVYY